MQSRVAPEMPNQGTFVRVSVINQYNERPFELDIVHMKQGNGYVISCTTDDTLELAKSKLFELSARSKQLCGRYTRAALVALIEPDAAKKLEKDLNSDWIGTQIPPRVFGMEDLRKWISGNTKSLYTFLSQV